MAERTDRIDPGLLGLLDSFWPCDDRLEASVRGQGRPEFEPVASLVVVPNAQSPRFVLPLTHPQVMAATLSTYNRLRAGPTRTVRRLLAAACRLGVVGSGGVVRGMGQVVELRASPDQGCRSFFELLRQRLNRPDLQFAFGIGTIDHHYKPTVQAFGSRGEPVAFAKLGWTPPTAELVARETSVLEQLHARATGDGGGRTPSVLPPPLLDHGRWHASPYLVTGALPTDVRSVPARQPLPNAARSIAGPLHEQPLATSAYHNSVVVRIAALAERGTDRTAGLLTAALEHLERSSANTVWRFGRWHGDFVPWNIARRDGQLHVWDWEHSTDQAPWGFDQLHWTVTVPHLTRNLPYPRATAAATIPPDQIGAGSLPQLRTAYLIEMMLRSLALTPADTTHQPLYPELDRALETALTTLCDGAP